MIYIIHLKFEKLDVMVHMKYYYSILGAILQLFQSDETLFESIIKISYTTDKDFLYIKISVLGAETYTKIVNKLIENPQKEISIDKQILRLKQLNLSTKIFDLKDINYIPYKSFTIQYLSPSFVRQENIIYTLPVPEQFLYSVYSKLKTIFRELDDYDDEEVKKNLKTGIYIGSFDIKTELVKIKGALKSGVIGNVKYYVKDDLDEKYKLLIYIIIKSISAVGIGSGVRLGCGNATCFIHK